MSENNDTAEEERALDAMLDEALGGTRPPDLSSEILAQFYGADANPEKAVSRARSWKTVQSKQAGRKTTVVAVVTIGALAAMLAGLIFLQPDHDISDNVAELVENAGRKKDGAETQKSDLASSSDEQPRKSAKKNTKRKNRKAAPIILQPPQTDHAEVSVPPSDSLDVTVPDETEVDELELVSAKLDAEMEGYWDAVGIESTEEATAEQTAVRLEKSL